MLRLLSAARRTFSTRQLFPQREGAASFKIVKDSDFEINRWRFPSFGVLSDTHTEFYQEIPSKMEKHLKDLASLTPWLVLAGDIGQPSHPLYRQLLKMTSCFFQQVILVSGNHEYYRLPANCDKTSEYTLESEKDEFERYEAKIEEQIRENISDLNNVHFLQREGVTLDWGNAGGIENNRIHFLGCTLWSAPHPRMWKDNPQMKGVNWEKYTKMHQRDREWLRESLLALNYEKTTREEKKVVITHHLPSTQMVHGKYNGIYNGMYASSQEKYLSLADVWVCGHSHTYMRKKINSCLCVLNPYGYLREESGIRQEVVKIETLDTETNV